MAAVNDIFYQFQASGIFEFVLPFLLVFTIVFAVLEKTRIFGTEGDDGKTPRKNINLIVSLVLALIVINQFEIVDRLNLFIPKVSLFIIVAVMFLVLVGIFGVNVHEGFSGITLFLFAVASLLIIYWALVPSSSSDFFTGSDFGYWIQDNLGTLLVLVIIGIVVWAVAGGGKKGDKGGGLAGFENWFNTNVGRKKHGD